VFSLDPNKTIVLGDDCNINRTANRFFWGSYALFEVIRYKQRFRKFCSSFIGRLAMTATEWASMLVVIIRGNIFTKFIFPSIFKVSMFVAAGMIFCDFSFLFELIQLFHNLE